MRAARLLFLVLLLMPLTTPADAPRGARDADGRKAGGRSDDLGVSQYGPSLVGHAHIDLA
jgi:hypothetical protein